MQKGNGHDPLSVPSGCFLTVFPLGPRATFLNGFVKEGTPKYTQVYEQSYEREKRL